jgi:hypothetical protein
MGLDLDPASRTATGHDPVRDAPGLLAAPFEEISRSLDLYPRLSQRLALLARHRERSRLHAAAQDIGRFLEDAAALPRRNGLPFA